MLTAERFKMGRNILDTTIELAGKPYNVKVFSPDQQRVFRVIIGLVAELYFKKDDSLGWIDVRKNQNDELAEKIGKLIEKKRLR